MNQLEISALAYQQGSVVSALPSPAKPMQTTGLIPGMSNASKPASSIFGGMLAQSAGAILAPAKENTPPRANGSSGKRVKVAPEFFQPDLQGARKLDLSI